MIKYLDHTLEIKSLNPDGYFSGYASVFDLVDQHKEAIQKGAFQKTLGRWGQRGTLPKMLWQHETETPIGIWREIFEDEHGLFVSGQLLLGIQKGKEAYCLLKSGAVDSMSIGFKTLKSRRDATRGTRIIEEVDLYEISLVTFPANPKARVTSYKTDGLREQLLTEKIHTLAAKIRNS